MIAVSEAAAIFREVATAHNFDALDHCDAQGNIFIGRAVFPLWRSLTGNVATTQPTIDPTHHVKPSEDYYQFGYCVMVEPHQCVASEFLLRLICSNGAVTYSIGKLSYLENATMASFRDWLNKLVENLDVPKQLSASTRRIYRTHEQLVYEDRLLEFLRQIASAHQQADFAYTVGHIVKHYTRLRPHADELINPFSPIPTAPSRYDLLRESEQRSAPSGGNHQAPRETIAHVPATSPQHEATDFSHTEANATSSIADATPQQRTMSTQPRSHTTTDDRPHPLQTDNMIADKQSNAAASTTPLDNRQTPLQLVTAGNNRITEPITHANVGAAAAAIIRRTASAGGYTQQPGRIRASLLLRNHRTTVVNRYIFANAVTSVARDTDHPILRLHLEMLGGLLLLLPLPDLRDHRQHVLYGIRSRCIPSLSSD